MDAALTASEIFANVARFTDAYYAAIQPLCERSGLPPMAVDILMFLANNPGHGTAGELCRCRGLKPAIVSFHVERLVQEGYLLRQSVPGDRRKTALVCTPKADALIEEGRVLQRAFAQRLTEGLSAEDLAHFHRCVAVFSRNIDCIRRGGTNRKNNRSEEPK